MKKALALVCALVVTLVLVPLAVAGDGNGGGHGRGHGKNKFQLNGKVVSFDAAGGSLVVIVKSGSKTVKSYRGQELPLVVDPAARVVDSTGDEASGDTDAPGTLDMLVADARVHLGGRIDRTDPANPVFIATKVIIQWLPEVVPEPEPAPTDTPTPDPSDTSTPDPSDTPIG